MTTIHIPDSHGDLFRRTWGDQLDRVADEAILIEGYRSGRFGAATIGQLLGHVSRWETEQWLAERGVALNYTPEDLESDRRTFDELFRRA